MLFSLLLLSFKRHWCGSTNDSFECGDDGWQVVAAGNFLASACNYSPARSASVITVGSCNSLNTMSWFSNFGSCTNIFAPVRTSISVSLSLSATTGGDLKSLLELFRCDRNINRIHMSLSIWHGAIHIIGKNNNCGNSLKHHNRVLARPKIQKTIKESMRG